MFYWHNANRLVDDNDSMLASTQFLALFAITIDARTQVWSLLDMNLSSSQPSLTKRLCRNFECDLIYYDELFCFEEPSKISHIIVHDLLRIALSTRERLSCFVDAGKTLLCMFNSMLESLTKACDLDLSI